MCRGYIERFYFNSMTKSCEKFIYGGCGGNENNFDSREVCIKECSDAAKDNNNKESSQRDPIPTAVRVAGIFKFFEGF